MEAIKNNMLELLQRNAEIFVSCACMGRGVKLKKWAVVPKFSVCLEIPLLENSKIGILAVEKMSVPYANFCVTDESLIFFNEN